MIWKIQNRNTFLLYQLFIWLLLQMCSMNPLIWRHIKTYHIMNFCPSEFRNFRLFAIFFYRNSNVSGEFFTSQTYDWQIACSWLTTKHSWNWFQDSPWVKKRILSRQPACLWLILTGSNTHFWTVDTLLMIEFQI